MTSLGATPPGPHRRARWARIGTRLVGATMAYNAVEAAVAMGSGVAAGSIALVGFGLDSGIEMVAAAALLWRLRLESGGAGGEHLESGELRVRRLVGGTFLVLALYVCGQAGWTLWTREEPRESLVGIILAGVSLLVMPLIAWGKLRAAREIGSAALAAEARETVACAYLSFTLLLGLAANAAAGWWWADPAAALLMVPWLIHEGIEGLGAEACEEEGAE